MRRIFKNITSGHAFELIAEVEEGITGIKRNDTAEITYYNFREKFRFLEGEDNFKPGLVYTSYVSIVIDIHVV
ncbi:hypothetical protein DPMN_116573 [Dreissena polymorpha]|uniref:Uncharacterized protein n=1 Tax=Dreissena polymorpha TaxID=45954 RepID=A0A9D4KNT6_DREPO|nr:hypothetical protein DPMN_116573 [Dreissena polymorpha]